VLKPDQKGAIRHSIAVVMQNRVQETGVAIRDKDREQVLLTQLIDRPDLSLTKGLLALSGVKEIVFCKTLVETEVHVQLSEYAAKYDCSLKVMSRSYFNE